MVVEESSEPIVMVSLPVPNRRFGTRSGFGYGVADYSR